MQFYLSLKPEKPLVIPYNYNYQLQSSLYSMLGEVGESDFWHDNGYGGVTKYKGFCFGKLEGKYAIDRELKKIKFEDEISLEIRSCVFDFIDAFQRAVERHPYIKLYDTKMDIVSASLGNRHLSEGTVLFDIVTPVVIHNTEEDGHTIYLSPEDEDFFPRICDNVEKKYEMITDNKPDMVSVRPCGEYRKTVTKYKDFYITGYTGRMEIKSSIKMLEFIYNTGLGEKNSQGFGFVRACRKGT